MCGHANEPGVKGIQFRWAPFVRAYVRIYILVLSYYIAYRYFYLASERGDCDVVRNHRQEMQTINRELINLVAPMIQYRNDIYPIVIAKN